jgi:tRNA modification GTPase
LEVLLTDTIAAISSVPRPGARIIVRLSGEGALAIAATLFDSSVDLPAPGSATRRDLRLGKIRFGAWVYFFLRPRTPTGEDLVELHLPGSPLIASRVLRAVLAAGARAASPGEFTARAFFNGKIDLAQAEGVAAMIAADDADSLRFARALAAGELSRRLAPIVQGVTNTLALVEAGIDFTDEDVTFLSGAELIQQIDAADANLADLLKDARRLEAADAHLRAVLAGWPNAGKSTLINALARGERAVVSDQSGTTRDSLEAVVRLTGGQVMLLDLPGLNSAGEMSGDSTADSPGSAVTADIQARARDEILGADYVLLVRDVTDDRRDCELAREADLVIFTKADLRPDFHNQGEQILVSAKTGLGMEELRRRLDALFFARSQNGRLAMATRHIHAVIDARKALARARAQASVGAELAALELRESLDCLGAITGTISPDDVLARVFSTFCIGK